MNKSDKKYEYFFCFIRFLIVLNLVQPYVIVRNFKKSVFLRKFSK